jgi:osmotically inducible protein OsmC
VPRIERTADVVWEGNLARGTGHITGGSGALDALPYSLPTRVGRPDGKTSPEELLAAAHGGCLTMSLAGELTEAGSPPERLEVTCRIVMDEVEGAGHQIVASQVTIRGTDDRAAVERADAGCPFSTLLRNAGVDVTVELG